MKGAVNTVRDALPTTTSIKKNLADAKEQVQDAAHTVKETLKETIPPLPKGRSGEPSGKIGDPVFLEEAGETAVPPPLPQAKYKQ